MASIYSCCICSSPLTCPSVYMSICWPKLDFMRMFSRDGETLLGAIDCVPSAKFSDVATGVWSAPSAANRCGMALVSPLWLLSRDYVVFLYRIWKLLVAVPETG